METVHFCPPAAKEGGKAEVGIGQWCGHCPPLAKSPHRKSELAKFCHEALTVRYLESHTHSPSNMTGVGERWH